MSELSELRDIGLRRVNCGDLIVGKYKSIERWRTNSVLFSAKSLSRQVVCTFYVTKIILINTALESSPIIKIFTENFSQLLDNKR
jgi:hypothetical protein